MRRGPRWLHRIYARTLGYFWLPCPECGRPFGGHEWDGLATQYGVAVCGEDER